MVKFKLGPVSGGFNKWQIGIDENDNVVVEYGYHPLYGSIMLADGSEEDFQKIVDLFNARIASMKLEKHVKDS